MVMMAKVQRVKKVQLWPVWLIALVATILAACTDLIIFGSITCAMWILPKPLTFLFLALAVGLTILVVLLPAAVLIAYHPRLKRWYHGFLFGGMYGLMMLFYPWVVSDFFGIIWSLQNDLAGVVNECLVPATVAFVVGGSLLVLVWVASRGSRGKLQIVDGTCCPGCGYNLVGNTTYICSECGQPFTLEELDITAEDLEPVQ